MVSGPSGAIAVSYVAADLAKPFVAVFLFGLGVYVLGRFSFRRRENPVKVRPVTGKFLGPLGLVAGFMDAAGGGGWGPIATPTLLSSGRMEPRKIIGTVDTSEFVVASCASVGFLFALSFQQIPWQIVGALLAGGIVAAPIAAWVVRILPMRILGTSVGGIMLVTNMQTFLDTVGVSGTPAQVIYALIVTVWMAALAFSIVVNNREKTKAALESQSA